MAPPAGRLRAKARLGVADAAQHALRSRARADALHGLPRAAGGGRTAGLRRHRRQRAPPERLRPDAVAQHHGRRAHQDDEPREDPRARQRAPALRPPAARGRGGRHARRHVGRADDRRHGRRPRRRGVLLRDQPHVHARTVPRGPRPDRARVDGARALSLRGQALRLPLRQRVAAHVPAAAPAHLDPRLRLHRDDPLRGRPALPVHRAALLAVRRDVRALRRAARIRGQPLRLRRAPVTDRLAGDDLRGRDGHERARGVRASLLVSREEGTATAPRVHVPARPHVGGIAAPPRPREAQVHLAHLVVEGGRGGRLRHRGQRRDRPAEAGSMPHEMALRNMERFARHVMPAIREEFPQ